MSRFTAFVYDRFMRNMEQACGARWRDELLAGVGGSVLEIGAGTGKNLEHYRSAAIEDLTLAEPDPHMRRRLAATLARSPLAARARIVDWRAEAVALAAASVDAVVCTLVLCSVRSQAAVLAEAHRVLRPAGRLVVLEHVASPDPRRLAWQRRLDPVWSRVADGCHVARDTARAIEDAGFAFEILTRESARKALPIVRPTIRGVARRA
jgi:ubiquinone/menaquinone biosynthesis C-methylase UbiE